MKALVLIFLFAGCAYRKPPSAETKNPDYQPAVNQQIFSPAIRDINDPSSEPGSPTSLPNQQLPKASP